MNRILAIVERDMRKFFRSPALMMVSMIFPLVQLIVLGNAFGGKIHDARLGIVDHDCGSASQDLGHPCGAPDLAIRDAMNAVHANARTISTVYYNDEKQAVADVQNGTLNGAIVIPEHYSRDVYQQKQPRIGLVLDNTDNFMTSTLEGVFNDITHELNQPAVQSQLPQQIALSIVELYPYIEYLKYLLPGSISLAMFVSVMIGGGIVYIDDKARGVHEGYLVTPISKLELVFGLNLAGALKAALAGIVLSFIGSLLAGVSYTFQPQIFVLMLLMIVCTSLAFVTMMSFIMARIDDPLVPRAIFGILNTLLFFPSGAIYPVQAFPLWLRWIAYADPFSYAVHGFKALLLRHAGFIAIWPDLLYLTVFAAVMLTGATLLFKRTL
jgi:ABC-type multidrug transport system permease subunit